MVREDRKGTILVVDDSPPSLDVLRDTLEGEGYRVYVATSGEKALVRALQSMPDIILLDVLMPGMDGFETCRRLKADEKIREIPVIFMTGLTDTAHKIRGFEVGGADYVTKPIEIGELVARVAMHMGLHTMQEQLKTQNESLQHEITERKRVEEEIKHIKMAVDVAGDAIVMLTADGHHFYQNNAFDRLFGYTQKEVSFLHPIKLYGNKDVGKKVFETIIAGKSWQGEIEMIAKNGRRFPVSLRADAIKDENGKIIGLIGVHTDITDRKFAEDKIKALLAEKELLLREVHHRIKNNMNVVMSLFSLQSSTLNDSPAISFLEDARNRVKSMLVLYDKLYQSGDFRKISTKEYLTSLIDEIIKNFPNRQLVTIERKIDDIILDSNILSPVGIILNELLTNIMKHAFNGKNSGMIQISFSMKENHATLIVQDNGTGIPESVDMATTTSFGLQLVNILITEQLAGTLRLERQNGSAFIMEFET